MNFVKKIFKVADNPIKTYADFWNWFQTNEKKFFKAVKNQKNIEKDFFEQINPKLKELKDGFWYLAGMKNKQTAELILTADGHIKNMVFIEEIINAVPNIKGWVFTAHKPTNDINNFSINMSGQDFSEKNINFYSNVFKNYPDEIDISIIHDDYNNLNEELIINGTYIFLENYIGELNLVTVIDNTEFIKKSEAKEELVPINKLSDFLNWRQKEFLEKYEGEGHQTENDNYALLEPTLNSDNHRIAVVNTDLLNWDKKASHPWILEVNISYNDSINGMPNNEISKILTKIEDDILNELKDFEGYLNIGRETLNDNRYIYFACKDFRKPSKTLYKIIKNNKENVKIRYEIYKDKYWQSFKRFDYNFS